MYHLFRSAGTRHHCEIDWQRGAFEETLYLSRSGSDGSDGLVGERTVEAVNGRQPHCSGGALYASVKETFSILFDQYLFSLTSLR